MRECTHCVSYEVSIVSEPSNPLRYPLRATFPLSPSNYSNDSPLDCATDLGEPGSVYMATSDIGIVMDVSLDSYADIGILGIRGAS